MSTYSLAIRHTDGKYDQPHTGLTAANAEKIGAYFYDLIKPEKDWEALVVFNEATLEIYSELEW